MKKKCYNITDKETLRTMLVIFFGLNRIKYQMILLLVDTISVKSKNGRITLVYHLKLLFSSVKITIQFVFVVYLYPISTETNNIPSPMKH